MRKSDTIIEKINIAKAELADLKSALKMSLNGSWETRDGSSSRRVTVHSPMTLNRLIREKEAEISDLEAQLAGWSHKSIRLGVKF